MSINFKKVAQENTLLSAIMVGRDKLETEEVINKELTIIYLILLPNLTKRATLL